MSKTIRRKNPIIAGILAFIFGPFGYLYLGFNFLIAGVTISIIVILVLAVLNLPYPTFFTYLQVLVYAYFGYKFAQIINDLSKEIYSSEEDMIKYNSISFAFFLMILAMEFMVQFYALVIGIYWVISAFSQGEILIALLILIFGIGLFQFFLDLIFSFISVVLMKIFKIDKKYL